MSENQLTAVIQKASASLLSWADNSKYEHIRKHSPGQAGQLGAVAIVTNATTANYMASDTAY